MTKKPSSDAREKLKVLEQSSDGFVIADADLKIRGPGEILGKAQSGLDGLKLGDLLSDTDLVRQAQSLAAQLINDDPLLKKTKNNHLLELIDNLGQFEDLIAQEIQFEDSYKNLILIIIIRLSDLFYPPDV